MPQLLLATNNPGKVHEFRQILQGIPFELVTPSQMGIRLEVEETGTTYQENARLKAVAFTKASGLPALADDSGLEVDVLDGAPGIRSSRYAGEGARDTDRVTYLLRKLQGVPLEKRAAHFCCVIAIAVPGDRLEYCCGECYGLIALAPSGKGGFGYDPVFYFPELKKTMAELPPEIKNEISHRARAAKEARIVLGKIFQDL